MNYIILSSILTLIFGLVGAVGLKNKSQQNNPLLNYTGHVSESGAFETPPMPINNPTKLNTNSRLLSPEKQREFMNARALRELDDYDNMQQQYRALKSAYQGGRKTRRNNKRNKTRRNKTRKNQTRRNNKRNKTRRNKA